MNEQKVNIENRLLSNESFMKLDKLLNRFNIFEATDMGRREIKHTKFLSYLLNPNESHGLGEAFIKNFITRVSENLTKFPSILDLDLAFAQVKPEYYLKPNHLDCLIKIPFRKHEDYLYIAIENKIDAGQGVAQLSKYSEGLEEKGFEKIFKYYLTFNYDDPPKEDSWIHITYEDVLLPSVKTTIDMLDETGSIYLKNALQDYYDLMFTDAEIDDEIDQLANVITSDKEIDGFIKSLMHIDKIGRENNSSIEIKHPKTIKFLYKYDSDQRSGMLKSWMKLPPTIKLEDGMVFSRESSSRSWLRFSILTDENRENLKKLTDDQKKWLDSKCPIAYEVIVREKSEKHKFQCQLVLVLGPIRENEKRQSLLNTLGKTDTNSEFWTRLEVLTKKPEETEQPFDWVMSTLFKVSVLGKIVPTSELANALQNSASHLNEKLSRFFEETDI